MWNPYNRKKSMVKILTGLLLTLTLLNPVANADPFSTTWEWVEEHPDTFLHLYFNLKNIIPHAL
jgi:hypothetical protein